jgi:hypothetical protein
MKTFVFAAAFMAASPALAERLTVETVVSTPTEALLAVYPDFVHMCERGSGDMCEAVGMIVGELSARGCRFSDYRNALPYKWDCR